MTTATPKFKASKHSQFRLSVNDNRSLDHAYWLVFDTDDEIQSGLSIAEVRNGDGDITGDERANADRLALAWNCHDALVEALSEVSEWIANWDPNFVHDDDWPATRAKIRAALTASAASASSSSPTDGTNRRAEV